MTSSRSKQRPGGGVPHPVDLLVDGRFLLDIGIGPRHISFGLIVIVVGDEVFDGVVGEEALELAVELRRQRLVGREDQGRPVGGGDHLGHGEGLARAGDAEQHLVALLALHAIDEFGDGRGLVALGLVLRTQLERDAAFRFVGPGRAMRHPGLGLETRVAGLQELLEHLGRGRSTAEAARMFGDRRFGLPALGGWWRHQGPGRDGFARVERRLRGFGETLGTPQGGAVRHGRAPAPFVQGRVQQRREMLVERHDVGTSRLTELGTFRRDSGWCGSLARAARAGGFRGGIGVGRAGFRHPLNMGSDAPRGKPRLPSPARGSKVAGAKRRRVKGTARARSRRSRPAPRDGSARAPGPRGRSPR